MDEELIAGNIMDVRELRASLLTWGRDNFRSFPWRFASDPYLVLISEVMLHRTQAVQVVPVYSEFVRLYPTVSDLARAAPGELLLVLRPLGLSWRTQLVGRMARELAERYGGDIPREFSELVSLPGVSEYIARAVRCFAWNLPEPLVDTNVVRVVSRLFGIEVRDANRRNRTFRDLVAALVDPEEPRRYTYALLDLASQVCTVRAPANCEGCWVMAWCISGRYRVCPQTREGAASG